MRAEELRVGNLVQNDSGKSRKINGYDLYTYEVNKGNWYTQINPIPLTEEWLLKFGFKKQPHYTVMDSIIIDIGRNRYLSIGNVGTPNEMMFILEKDRNYTQKINDLICIHNYDYDGYLTVHKLQNLYFALTNKELKIKELKT